MFPLVVEVAGELSDPRYFPSQEEKASDARDNETDDEKCFTEAGYIKHSMPPLGTDSFFLLVLNKDSRIRGFGCCNLLAFQPNPRTFEFLYKDSSFQI